LRNLQTYLASNFPRRDSETADAQKVSNDENPMEALAMILNDLAYLRMCALRHGKDGITSRPVPSGSGLVRQVPDDGREI
jgi:hypothetical protein